MYYKQQQQQTEQKSNQENMIKKQLPHSYSILLII